MFLRNKEKKIRKEVCPMPRLILNDEKWSKLKPIILQMGIYNKRNLRLTVEGILLSLKSGMSLEEIYLKSLGNGMPFIKGLM